MSCPLNRRRWAGSGYTKEASESPAAKELDTKMLEIQAARNLQDMKYFPSVASNINNVSALQLEKMITASVVRK